VVVYDHHKILLFKIRTEEQSRILLENERSWGLDYFTHHMQAGGFVGARISPKDFGAAGSEHGWRRICGSIGSSVVRV